MPYTFELTFTGLCIFTFLGEDKRRPREVDVLLVYGLQHSGPHRHLPYLGFAAEYLNGDTNPKQYGLVPGYDGSQTALLSLAGKNGVRIVLPSMHVPPLHPIWRPTTVPELPEAPDQYDPEQEKWLDWAMALQRMNPETDDPDITDPYGGLDRSKITTRVILDAGTLSCREFPRRANNSYLTWEFDVPETTPITTRRVVTHSSDALVEPSVIGPYAMARSVVLRIENIPDGEEVRIVAADLQVALVPPVRVHPDPDEVVRASITNLPEISDPNASKQTHLTHFAHFYDPVIFLQPPPRLRLPRRQTAGITSGTSFCPPTTHTRAE